MVFLDFEVFTQALDVAEAADGFKSGVLFNLKVSTDGGQP